MLNEFEVAIWQLLNKEAELEKEESNQILQR